MTMGYGNQTAMFDDTEDEPAAKDTAPLVNTLPNHSIDMTS